MKFRIFRPLLIAASEGGKAVFVVLVTAEITNVIAMEAGKIATITLHNGYG